MTKPKPIPCRIISDIVQTDNSDVALELHNQGRFGEIEDHRVHLSFLEGLYLLEKEKIKILDSHNKKLSSDAFLKKAERKEKKFWVKYRVYRDLRDRGYLVKTALKFGADFRVYDRGVKPGEDHAKWIVYPTYEADVLTWYDFSAKNRVAHSTKKRLLLAVVDAEGDVSFWETRWLRP
ncbi:tRNA-intron lyase [Candidatus Woesearchaeota archaeon]|nr:tRNA-intron lyase [Candidatus Woesearchaeota archaeon]